MGSQTYYIVNKNTLPDYFEKVVETKRLLSNGTCKEVSAAVRITGISRSTYYKYKDSVFEPDAASREQRAVFFMMLSHEKGVLSKVLTAFSDADCNIITITQSPPIAGSASVTLTCDVSHLAFDMNELIKGVSSIHGVEQLRLISLEEV